MRIFYNDVKGQDWTDKQGFPKFLSAYYYINSLGITKFSSKIDEQIDLTNCIFCKEVDDIIKCYAVKDVCVLDTLFKKAESIKEIEEITKKRIKNNETNFNYDKEHDLFYVSLKNCPNHYVDLLEDKHFDLWRDSETDEVVGAHIWNAGEWFRTVLKTVEANSMDKEEKK